ncbi:MAG: PAS domain-containing protein [Alphaproteobacteria bacterium]|nr:PAS domain-containing protein [Alphaproteobacteria bacterium]
MTAGMAEWHPKLRQLHDYWQRIHPAPGKLPGRQHFDPLEIHTLLPNIWLIDVIRPEMRFRYRLVGTQITEALGDTTGRWLDDVHPDFHPGSPTYENYLSLANGGEPSWRRGKPVLMAYSESCVEIERLLLPLASDGLTVDVIVALTVMFGLDGTEK